MGQTSLSDIVYRRVKEEERRPISGQEISEFLDEEVKIIRYEDLEKYDDIEDLLYPYGKVVILYETGKNVGHWVCVLCTNGKVEFFDPYDYYPDDELKYSNNKDQLMSRLLYEYLDEGGEVEYNDHKFQARSRNISTCGRWCEMRLLFKDYTLEEFKDMFMDIPKESGLTPDEVITFLTM